MKKLSDFSYWSIVLDLKINCLSDSLKKTLLERDAAVVWHPYTQHKAMQTPLPVISGNGVWLTDEKGNRYIDAISSWWTNLHGHAHPYIAQKIYKQALQLEQVLFAGCTHEPAVQLAERLLALLPGRFSRVFYSDNGSTAVEVALKMAIQFHANKRNPARKKILALRHSYHGDTFGAMSVSERSVFTLAFGGYLFEVVFMEPGGTLPGLPPEEIACFIYEPLVQGAGGMNMYDAGWLDRCLDVLQQAGVLCIADEVMTGFGRTGSLFASSVLKNAPDIICLSKGLTGGSLPLAVTACTRPVFDAFYSDDLYKTFFHGHSYTANPLACAAALASMELLEKKECRDAIASIAAGHDRFVKKLSANSAVIRPRSRGTILAFEFYSEEKDYLNKVKEETMQLALDRGVLLRPLGNTVYVMPPYCIREEELKKVYDTLEEIISRF
jgi:adenosylmethionine-8-amino-7-oxononanoate aminotransferase